MVPGNYEVVPPVLAQFLRRTMPFNELDDDQILRLAVHWAIEYYPKGSLILKQGSTEITHLHVIQKGGVKIYLNTGDSAGALKDFGGEGAAFGALNMILGEPADINVEAVEDTFCFLLEKEPFLELVASNPRIAQFFLEGFSEDFLSLAYSELRSEKVKARKQESLYLFNASVRDIIKRPAETIPENASVQEAAARMAELGIGSLLVTDSSEGLVGIITDKDLRSKVVAAGLGYDVPVSTIMAAPVHTIPSESVCFDALLEHIKQEVDHLVIQNRDRVVGVITAEDILVYQGAWPLYLFREIMAQRKMEGLHDLSKKVPTAVRGLIEEGARPSNIARVITLLNDSLLARLLDFILEEMGPPPVPFCWLTMGSDGRKEQTFRTDQDNALVYEDPRDRAGRHAAETYFEVFARSAAQHLEICGYPRCKSEIMATNPRWCKPYSTWSNYFDEWLSAPDPREVSLATTFLDFRPVYGEKSLAQRLRRRITEQVQRQYNFQMRLAGDCMSNWPPLSFFRHFIVEKTGERTSRLDLKSRCLMPFVNFARLMALRMGVEETNTLERLRLLAESGHISQGFYADARDAYEFETQLNLVHQLEMIEAGLPASDTFIDPVELSELERKTLKEVFGVISKMLAYLKQEFPFVV
jgi:CBS domain-containing protein